VWLESTGAITDNTTGTAPSAGALLLATVTTSGGAITAITHYRATETMDDFVLVVKPSDESVTSSTAMQSDDHLTFTAAARSKWLVEFYVAVTTASNDSGYQSLVRLAEGGGGVVSNYFPNVDAAYATPKHEVLTYAHTTQVDSTAAVVAGAWVSMVSP
jgi:mannose-1-phosphate guanylyltransferase